ncbi:hypothetical protein [Archaeoglobus sp.]
MSNRSSITCSVKQRSEFRQIKEKLAKIYGKEEYEITDRQVFQHLLDTFNKYQHLCFITIAKDFSNQLENSLQILKEVITTYEEIEKLQQENEELRKELEELKKRQTTAVDPSNYEECYRIFLRALSKMLESAENVDEEIAEGFTTFMELFCNPSKALEGLALLGRASRVFNVRT